MKRLFVLAGVFAFAAATPVLAANANHPYQNCDKKVDNCGPTGDETTDRLNGQQLGGAPTSPAPATVQGNPMPNSMGNMPARQ